MENLMLSMEPPEWFKTFDNIVQTWSEEDWIMRYIPTYNTNIDEQISRNREIIMRLPDNILPGVDEDSRFTTRGPGSVGEPFCKLQALF